MWVNFKQRCPNCNSDLFKDSDCCTQAPEGMQCKPDEEQGPPEGIGFGRCERFYTNLGQDEIALNCEVGLYLDFKVSDTGIPYGCSGLETFNNTVWKSTPNGCPGCWSRVPRVENPDPFNNGHWQADEVTCPLNKLQEPIGSTPLHEVFEEYAADQQKWVNDYVPTFEKMISNGYTDGELQDAPDQWTDVVCPRPSRDFDPYKYHSCYHTSEISPNQSFYLISRKNGLAIQGDDQGVAKLTTLDYDNPKQRWVHTSSQDLINMGTNLPLIIVKGVGTAIGRAWKFTDRNIIVETVKGQGEKALFFWGGWDTSKTEFDLTYFPIMENHLETYQYDKVMYVDVVNGPTNTTLDGPKYLIRSERDQRVVTMVENQAKMYSMEEGNANQLWMQKDVDNGFEFINVGTNLALTVGQVSAWNYDTENHYLVDANGSGMVLRRGRQKIEGAGVGWSEPSNSNRNKFLLEQIEE